MCLGVDVTSRRVGADVTSMCVRVDVIFRRVGVDMTSRRKGYM